MNERLYTYYPEFDENDYLLWHVYEKRTNQVIHSFFFEDDAQEYMEQLENGQGFAGFTPSFITRKVPSVKDINEAFSAEFA
jgi:hypothetical protein